ncbi:MAG: BrnA antitoxin family protein [Nitrosomonas sp.]|nr:BrnA antitoxin family protein [Nitrosomonas sp.]
MSISKKRLKEIEAIKDKDIDYSDIPELDETFWKNAVLVHPERKERLTVRFDAEMVAWFKKQGRGYQTRMNAVLKSFYEAHKNEL